MKRKNFKKNKGQLLYKSAIVTIILWGENLLQTYSPSNNNFVGKISFKLILLKTFILEIMALLMGYSDKVHVVSLL